MIQEVKKSSHKTTAVLTMKDILKKENPGASLQTWDSEAETFSSFYKKKRDVKEERKGGINKSSNKSEIKKAVERIVRY
jgi:hypothetical protein